MPNAYAERNALDVCQVQCQVGNAHTDRQTYIHLSTYLGNVTVSERAGAYRPLHVWP